MSSSKLRNSLNESNLGYYYLAEEFGWSTQFTYRVSFSPMSPLSVDPMFHYFLVHWRGPSICHLKIGFEKLLFENCI